MSAKAQERPSKKAKTVHAPLKSALKSSKTSFSKVKAKSPSPAPATATSTSTKKAHVQDAPTKPKPALKRSSESAKASGKGKEKLTSSHPTVLPTTFKVVVGTYEKLLYGLEGSFSSSSEDGSILENPQLRLKPIFIFPAHVSSVKAVAASPEGGKWLATGSTDEIVKVWDLRRRKEIGGLVQHEGSITHLSFSTRSHLFTASDDGTICIFRARDWVLLRSMKGHKGSVNCVAVHPSGKVGLSVGKDRTLRMWDLMRGKGSASTKLGKEGEVVRWSLKGDRFVVQSGKVIDIYSTDMELLHTVTHPSRIHDVRFCKKDSGDGELLLVAAEDKKVTVYDSSSDDSTSLPIVAELIGHQNRVKAIDILSIALPPSFSPRTSTIILSSISSDGWIRIFDLGLLPSPFSPSSASEHIENGKKTSIPTLTSISEYDTKGSRLICCSLAEGDSTSIPQTGKRKAQDEDSSNEESKNEENAEEVHEIEDEEEEEEEEEEDES